MMIFTDDDARTLGLRRVMAPVMADPESPHPQPTSLGVSYPEALRRRFRCFLLGHTDMLDRDGKRLFVTCAECLRESPGILTGDRPLEFREAESITAARNGLRMW